jgi:hypothetical protein
MFNTEKWCRLSEDTYGYQVGRFSLDGFDLYYSVVENRIGQYKVLPSFGDYVACDANQIKALSEFIKANSEVPLKVKLWSSEESQFSGIDVKKSGYIHHLHFESHEEWLTNNIKAKYRNQINQASKKGVQIKVLSDKRSVIDFWEMHADLRVNKFSEIPQPLRYFENIYESYFKDGKGVVVGAFNDSGSLIGGVMLLLDSEMGYYKYSASKLESLALRPNNLIMSEIIKYLESKGLNTLNLGFTGDSEQYAGLRHYKLKSGATEDIRYSIQTAPYADLDFSHISNINSEIQEKISSNLSYEEIDELANRYYKYFI